MTNKDAIKLIQEIEEDGWNVTSDHVKALALAIMALTSSSNDGWIPVSERLPEERINPYTKDFEHVLCSTIWGDVRPYKFGKRIGENKAHFWLCGGVMDKYITAWQPFPEPYKRGNDARGQSRHRPQGEWIPNYTSQFMNPGKQCSLCSKIVEFSENYCPNCGADMRPKPNQLRDCENCVSCEHFGDCEGCKKDEED